MNDENDKKKEKFEIKIDREKFEVEGPTITGTGLRHLPTPPIGSDRDLFLTVSGPSDDLLIKDDEVVKLEKHMRFFTAPTHIAPGGNAACG